MIEHDRHAHVHLCKRKQNIKRNDHAILIYQSCRVPEINSENHPYHEIGDDLLAQKQRNHRFFVVLIVRLRGFRPGLVHVENVLERSEQVDEEHEPESELARRRSVA